MSLSVSLFLLLFSLPPLCDFLCSSHSLSLSLSPLMLIEKATKRCLVGDYKHMSLDRWSLMVEADLCPKPFFIRRCSFWPVSKHPFGSTVDHTFIQQTFVECVLCAGTLGHQGYAVNRGDKNPHLEGVDILVGKTDD